MEVSIGISADLAGPEFEQGHALVQAVRLAVEERGGAFGIRLVAGDDRAEGPRAVAIAERLCADENLVAVVGPMTSAGVEQAGAVYERAGVPFLTPSASHASLSQRGWQHFFRLTSSDRVQARVIRDLLLELGRERLAIVTDRSSCGQGLSQCLAEELAGSPLVLLGQVQVDRGDSEGTQAGQEVCSLDPQVVFFALTEAQGKRVAGTLRQLGSRAVFVGTHARKGSRYLETTPSPAGGPYLTNRGVDLELTVPRQDFYRRYLQRFGQPPTVYSAESYDAGALIISALTQRGKDRQGLRAYLSGMAPYPGLSGSISFTLAGERREVEVGVYRLHHGQNQLVRRISL